MKLWGAVAFWLGEDVMGRPLFIIMKDGGFGVGDCIPPAPPTIVGVGGSCLSEDDDAEGGERKGFRKVEPPPPPPPPPPPLARGVEAWNAPDGVPTPVVAAACEAINICCIIMAEEGVT